MQLVRPKVVALKSGSVKINDACNQVSTKQSPSCDILLSERGCLMVAHQKFPIETSTSRKRQVLFFRSKQGVLGWLFLIAFSMPCHSFRNCRASSLQSLNIKVRIASRVGCAWFKCQLSGRCIGPPKTLRLFWSESLWWPCQSPPPVATSNFPKLRRIFLSKPILLCKSENGRWQHAYGFLMCC